MDEKTYIENLKTIRKAINDLVDELWNDPENKEIFKYRSELIELVIDDIHYGYNSEDDCLFSCN